MIFQRYILKKFIPMFLGAVGFFSFALILADLLINLWEYIARSVPLLDIAHVMFLYLPKTIIFALPLSLLFASSYVISDLYAKNELTSIFASGVSLFSFTLPLLIFGLLTTFFLFTFENNVVVPTYAKKIEMENSLLERKTNNNNDKVVIIGEQGKVIYKADYYYSRSKKLIRLYIVYRNEDKSLDAILRADNAIYRNNTWEFTNPILYKYVNNELITSNSLENYSIYENPEVFESNVTDVEAVNTHDAKVYIRHLRRAGLPYSEELSIYYKKFSYPFICFIVVFISIGLSGKTRKNVLLISLVLCVCSAVVFYVLQMVTMLLAKFGYIPPLVGAWFPVIFFILLSCVALRFART